MGRIGTCIATLLALTLVATACGGGSDATTPVEAAEAAEAPAATATPDPTATPEPEPTATPEPEPTATPEPEPTATSVPPTATPDPEPTATPEPEPAAEPEPTTDTTGTTDPSGTTDPATDDGTTDPSGTTDPATDDGTTDGDVDGIVTIDGAAIYQTSCAGCHGVSGEGARARAITGIGAFFATDDAPLVSLVTNGGTNMPAFGSRLSTAEIDAVVDYVVETFN